MLQELIVLVVAYIALIGWLNAPKKTTTKATEPEAVTVPTTTPQPKPIIEPMLKPAYVATAPKPKAIAVLKETTTEPAQDLSALPIRELYARASAKGIKRYKAMNKAALVEALS